MTHKKTNKSKIFALLFGLIMCLAFIPGIAMASPTSKVYAAVEDGTAPTIVKTGGNDVDRVNRMSNLPAAIKGKEYKADDGSNYKIEVTGTAPATFSIPLSYLPEGLSLNENTGEIVGTPTEAGNYTVTIYVENAYGSDNVLVSLRVYDDESKPTITTTQTDIAVGYVNSSYLQEINYVEGTGYPPEASITSGNLPTGLRLQPSGYAFYIEGTPTVADTFTFTVRMKNAAGFDEKQYTITIKNEIVAPEIQMDMTVINDSYSKVYRGDLQIIKGKEVDVQFCATGTNTSKNPIKWSCDTSVLPEGLALSESGHLTGTVAESVDIGLGVKYFSIKLTATNVSSEGKQSNTSSMELIVCENGKIAAVTTISPENTSVPKGGQRQFTATVIGYGDFDDSVTWKVYYKSSKDTKISQDGVLTVGIDETATKIQVEATSKGNTDCINTVWVTIINHTHTTTLVPSVPKTCTTDGNREHYKCNVCRDLFADAGAVN